MMKRGVASAVARRAWDYLRYDFREIVWPRPMDDPPGTRYMKDLSLQEHARAFREALRMYTEGWRWYNGEPEKERRERIAAERAASGEDASASGDYDEAVDDWRPDPDDTTTMKDELGRIYGAGARVEGTSTRAGRLGGGPRRGGCEGAERATGPRERRDASEKRSAAAAAFAEWTPRAEPLAAWRVARVHAPHRPRRSRPLFPPAGSRREPRRPPSRRSGVRTSRGARESEANDESADVGASSASPWKKTH